MKQHINRLWFVMLTVLLVTMMLPVPALADTGPKPSVRINFENFSDRLCYGTLLSERSSTGPQSAWDGNEATIFNYDLDLDIWRAFAEYEDIDGYYFLQIAWKVSETKQIAWTYYPPSRFKILLYYPETDTFAVSGVYERYAFDTYYTVDMDGVMMDLVEYDETLSTDERILAHRSYNYRIELWSLVGRIGITVFIEMAVAFLFGFLEKKQLLLLVLVNTATQILLNVLLNLINYNSGEWAFVFYYVFFELIVFAGEAVLYCTLIKKLSRKTRGSRYYVLYAFIANAVSFLSGLAAAHWIPGIF